jgi:hypothetical protein
MRDCRAALGSTVFWDRDELGDYQKPERAEIVCDILIRLAQSHYKLRWSLGSDKGPEDHSKRMEGNLRDAKAIVERIKARRTTLYDEAALLALDNSICVLDARIKYHDGNYPEARNIYSLIVERTRDHVNNLDLCGKGLNIWKLKIAEAFYYSQCQISRIDYQMRPHRCDWRKEQINTLQEVGRRIREICVKIAECRQDFGSDAEQNHCLNSFATILRITQWTQGRLTISVIGDLLPVQKERAKQEYEELASGLRLLQSDPWKELCKSVSFLENKTAWRAPARWLAMKNRYEARGRALKWLVSKQDDLSQDDPGSLLGAYACIQEASNQTRGRDLERQQMLNVLEAARLSTLITFGERVVYAPRIGGIQATPFSCAVALYHLNEAFNMMAILKTPSNDQWHCILAHRIASYFGLLVAPMREGDLNTIDNQSLRTFLGLPTNEMRNTVVRLYTEFASRFQQDTFLAERIAQYQQTFDSIQNEIHGIAFKTVA